MARRCSASRSPAEHSVRTPPRTPPARRKVLFEALENRLLLSADPLATLASDGVLAVQGSAGSDEVLVRRVGGAADGGEILDVQIGAFAQRFGDAAAGVKFILAQLGAGDDRIELRDVQSHAVLDGGAGSDTLFGPTVDSEWSITGWDSGVVASFEFTDFENLRGAADNRDTFSLKSGGKVSGLVDGGVGGFDTLAID